MAVAAPAVAAPPVVEPPAAEPNSGSIETGIGAAVSLVVSGELSSVAASIGLSSSELVTTLVEDPSMFVARSDGYGAVGYADPVAQPAEPIPADADPTPSATLTTAAAFALHSLPGATRRVFLDFDGHTSTGTSFNGSYGWPSTIVSPAFDRDGNAAAWSPAELQAIEDAWKMVAEDFAPFDVDITTEDPGVDALNYTGPGDLGYGIRVVITSDDDWFGGVVGGVAFLKSFRQNSNGSSPKAGTPAFVFSDNVGTSKGIAEAAAHEVGHTFGLNHDGIANGPAYYTGHAPWAPIMGAGYYQPLTQWSRGEYPGANNSEDDLALISEYVERRVDDHADTAAGATPVAPTSTTTGLIGVGDVADAFSIQVAAGKLDVAVAPASSFTSNLFASVTVRNEAGAVVGTATPTAVVSSQASKAPVDWTAQVSGTVPAGRYYVEVRPAGLRSGAPDGFSAYASIGAYRLTVAWANTRPMANVTATSGSGVAPLTVVFTGAGSTDAEGDALTYGWYEGATLVGTEVAVSRTFSTAGTHTLRLAVTDGQGATSEASAAVNVSAPGLPTQVRMTAITPVRLADTRPAFGGTTRLDAGGVLRLVVAGRNSVPSSATAAALNVTAVSPAAAGFLTVYSCASSLPVVSSVNFAAHAVIANATVATLSDAGEVCVFSSAATDVLVDLTGWFAASAMNAMTPQNPIRLTDTRTGLGGATRMPAGSIAVIDIPVTASAVALNIVSVEPAAAGFLTAFPCGAPQPNTSSVNFVAGEVRPNNAIVGTGAGGDVCVFASAETDIVVDLTASFSTHGNLDYVPAIPARLIDTRESAGMPAAGSTLPYTLPSPGAAFSATSVNVAAVDQTQPGFVTTFDCGQLPVASTVNTRVGEANSNGAIVPVRNSTSCLYTLASTQLIVDLLGWWVPTR